MARSDRQIKRLEKALHNADSYAEWSDVAVRLDEATGKDEWREIVACSDYDHELIASRVDLLRQLRRAHDVHGLMFYLREELHGNLGNIANPALYQETMIGTKRLIEEFLDEVVSALDYLCDNEFDEVTPEEKVEFFKRAAQSFGRSALMLSGGATLGLFHLGVIKEMHEHDLLPRVISGSSAGSIVAGTVGTHTDDELADLFELDHLDMIWSRMTAFEQIIKGEGILEIKQLKKSIDANIPSMTFEEAYARTHRKINISLSPADPNQFPRLLNYLSAPNVYVGRACLASSAIPGLFPPVRLYAKNRNGRSVPYMGKSRWIDGSVHSDLPTMHLSRMHNVNHFIVSQTNPHVVPFMNEEPTKGLMPFLRQTLFMGPLMQVENALEAARRNFNVPGLGMLIKRAHAITTQTYSGDITIYPEHQFSDYLRTLSNPSKKLIDKLILSGRRAAWPRLARVRNTTRISRCFDRCRWRLNQRYNVVRYRTDGTTEPTQIPSDSVVAEGVE